MPPVRLNTDRRFIVVLARQGESRFDRESTGCHRVEHVEKGIRQPRFGAALPQELQETGVGYVRGGREEQRDPSSQEGGAQRMIFVVYDLCQFPPERRMNPQAVASNQQEKGAGMVPGEPLGEPPRQLLITLGEVLGPEQRGHVPSPFEPCDPLHMRCCIGEEPASLGVGCGRVDQVHRLVVEGRWLVGDLRNVALPVEEPPLAVVGEAPDTFREGAVIALRRLLVPDWLDTEQLPLRAVRLVGEREAVARVWREGSREVVQDGVAVAVADEQDGARAKEVDQEAPRPTLGQVRPAEVGVGEHHATRVAEVAVYVHDPTETAAKWQRGSREDGRRRIKETGGSLFE